MSNKAVHQLPLVTDRDATDVAHIVRDPGSGYVDRKISTNALGVELLPFGATLSNAEILDLYDTPVSIIPSAGPDKIIMPWAVLIEEVGATTSFNAPELVAGSISTVDDTAYILRGYGPDAILPRVILQAVGGTSISPMIAGDAFALKGYGVNPTLGDGEYEVRGWYYIIDANA